jgi:nucleotide-binding universal stress UspA family protein
MKILLPTDFSENSVNAIKYTLRIMSSLKCDYLLLHTYQSPQAGASMVVSINELLAKGSEEGLNELKNNLLADHANDLGTLDTKSCYGSVYSGIRYCEEKEGIELVAMGTKGESGLQRILLGSNTAYAIQHASVPLLAIPQDATHASIDRILLALDKLDSHHLGPLPLLVKTWGAKLQLLQVISADMEMPVLTDSINGIPCEHNVRVHESVHDCIEEEVQKNEIDLVAVVAKHHGFFYHFMNRSVSRKLALHTHAPLLILRED